MLRVYEITGRLFVYDNSIDHQELIRILFDELEKRDIHFSGVTKEITDNKIHSEKQIQNPQ